MLRNLGIATGLLLFAAVHLPLFPAWHPAGPAFADEHLVLGPMFTLGGFAAAWFALPRRHRAGMGVLLRIGAVFAVLVSSVPGVLAHGLLGSLLGSASMIGLAMALVPAFTSPDPDVHVPRAIAVSSAVAAEWFAVTSVRWGGLDSARLGLVAALALGAVAVAWEVTARRRVPLRRDAGAR
jgi:hypothetical protein